MDTTGSAALAAAQLAIASKMPTIESFATAAGYTLVGNNVADDSLAVMAAHTQAVAAGVREVYCAKTYYAPSAYNIGQVLWRGPGAFTGTYRTRVIPFSARAMVGRLNTINPAIHLRKAAKAATAVNVLIWGDSTGTNIANHVAEREMIWPMLEKAILRDNPGRTVNFINRSIGGSDITLFNQPGTVLQAAGVTLPSWFLNSSAPWNGYVANQNPDLIIVNFGQNNPYALTPAELDVFIAYVNTLTKVPDVIFMTPTTRSTQADSGSAEYSALEGRDQCAGVLRTWCAYNGYPYIDMHRGAVIMRDGQDPCAQLFTDQIGPGASTSMALPAVMAMTGNDFDLIFTIDNTGGQAFGSSQHLWLSLSAMSNNVLQIAQSGSYIYLEGYSGGGTTFLVPTVTSVAMPSGVLTVEVAVRGPMMSVYLQGAAFPNYEIPVKRAGGQFQPTISYGSGSGPANITVTYYANSSPMTVQPAITDAEMFGTNTSGPATGSSGASGGNAVNHPASQAYETVHDLVIDQCNFCLRQAVGTNIQTFTASGTYTPTPGMQVCEAFTVGGGGGGGGGCLQAASTACSGGAGGGTPPLGYGKFLAATIGASQVVTIGAGGTAGAAAATSTTAGGAGGVGGTTSLGSLLSAYGGGGGAGGQIASSSGGGAGGNASVVGGSGTGSAGGAAPYGAGNGGFGTFGGNGLSLPGGQLGAGGAGAPAAGGSIASIATGISPCPGASGSGITAANGVAAGGGAYQQLSAGGHYTGGVAAPTTGSTAPSSTTLPISIGGGGCGGGSSLTVAGAGGPGGNYGGGGGGGGSAQNGGTAGAGGAGAPGCLVIVEYF